MIELTVDPPVARLTIRRPHKRNAMTLAMWEQLLAHCNRLAGEPGTRVVVVRGEGGAFCAGADIEEMATIARDPARLRAQHALICRAQLALERLPMPVLAAIDGPCFGGGFGIAAACDFRLATPHSEFAITPARLGIVYSVEDTRRVAALVGLARTKRLLLRSERLVAETALAWGVVDRVVDADALDAEVERWADALVRQSPVALAGMKATLALLAGQGAHTEAEVRAIADAAFDSADFAEGTRAFLEGRAPRF